jgi:adenylyltransferase/sulfurtransferase
MSARFSRQVRLSEVGEKGQQAIRDAKVLIVGMGGLGCPSAQYLVAAGLGFIGIADGDLVDETNLHRQILYSTPDIGKAKVEVAAGRLQALNPSAVIHRHFNFLNSENVNSILQNYDIVLDCTDNFETKFLLNDACLRAEKVLISGSATGFEANLMVVGVEGPCLRCLYPDARLADIGNCNLSGILGAFVGIIGSWQAAEVLKLILIRAGHHRNLMVPKGRVLFFDFYRSQMRSVSLEQNPECFCMKKNRGPEQTEGESLYLRLDQIPEPRDYVFIDVRSAEEREQESLPGFDTGFESIHIPYQDIMSGEWKREFWCADKKYVLGCSRGSRSATAAQWLRDQGVQNVYSLRRGP